MADEHPEVAGPAEDAGAPAPEARSSGFERYALLAALTLVVLCLLIWDNWHGSERSGPAPRSDRTLRVQIGGDGPERRAASQPERDGTVVHETPPPKPPAPPAPPPAPERTYTVKSGDTLSAIATRELGSATRAAEIAELDGLADAGLIRAGQVLKLPAR